MLKKYLLVLLILTNSCFGGFGEKLKLIPSLIKKTAEKFIHNPQQLTRGEKIAVTIAAVYIGALISIIKQKNRPFGRYHYMLPIQKISERPLLNLNANSALEFNQEIAQLYQSSSSPHIQAYYDLLELRTKVRRIKANLNESIINLKKATSYVRISVEELEYNLEQAEILNQEIIVRIAYLKSDPDFEASLATYKKTQDQSTTIRS